eukprot:366046-Chlamydomonas_euryale.AAC.3
MHMGLVCQQADASVSNAGKHLWCPLPLSAAVLCVRRNADACLAACQAGSWAACLAVCLVVLWAVCRAACLAARWAVCRAACLAAR